MRLEVVEVATQAQKDEIAGYGLGSHGLVAVGPTGVVTGKIPGHEFGAAEIVAQTDALLAR